MFCCWKGSFIVKIVVFFTVLSLVLFQWVIIQMRLKTEELYGRVKGQRVKVFFKNKVRVFVLLSDKIDYIVVLFWDRVDKQDWNREF